MKIRRITTAEAPTGVVTQTDEVFDTSTVQDLTHAFDIWGFDEVPELPLRPEQVLGEYKELGLFGPRGGIRVDIQVVPPVLGDEPPDLSAIAGNLNFGTGGGMTPGTEGAGMHRTDTVDFVVVLEGETNVAYPGEDGNVHEITIKAGDFLTHNGTFHRWHNRSAANCTLMLIPIAATRHAEETPG